MKPKTLFSNSLFALLVMGLAMAGVQCQRNSARNDDEDDEPSDENDDEPQDDETGGRGGRGGGGVAGTGGGGGAGGSSMGGSGGSNDEKRDAAAAMDGPPAPPPADCVPPKLKLTKVPGTFASPIVVTSPPGDARLFVAERNGMIRILENGQATVFADFRTSVGALETERGFQNLVFHPNYKDNGKFYVFYTRRADDPYSQGDFGSIVISEGMRSAANPNQVEKMLKPLVVQKHDIRYHNGGFMAFGPDGMLYAAIGEGGLDGFTVWKGMRGDPNQMQSPGPATALDTYIGKLLRIDVAKPDTKPAGNVEDSQLPYIYSIGLRNPFRGSFDRLTGDLWLGDVGEASWEEIDFVRSGTNGKHFGWGFLEGSHCFPWFRETDCERIGHLPIYEYFHEGDNVMSAPLSYMMMGRGCLAANADPGTASENACARAVIGGYVYRGKKIPKLAGRYIFADYVKAWVKSFVQDGGKVTCEVDLTADLITGNVRPRAPVSFGEDADGELYIVDSFDGSILRIDPE